MTGRQSYTPAPPVAETPPRPSSGAPGTIPTPTRPAGGATTRPAKRSPARRASPFGVALLLVGTVLLVISLFVGWYVVSETSTDTVGTNTFTVNESETLYLFNAQTLAFSCQGSSSCFASGTTSGTYTQGSLTGAATLYDVISGLILCAVIDLPYGFARRYLETGDRPPARRREALATAVRATIGSVPPG